VLRRELGDVDKEVAAIVTKDAHALDRELEQHKLAPLPALSALDREHQHDREPDALALHCAASAGANCDEDAAVATDERD
jgi:hypothetical protein